MNIEIQKLKELGAPDWYLAYLTTCAERGFHELRVSDGVGPMVLAWGYAQATNKRLANLVKKQESDRKALEDRWNKQVAHGRKLARDISEKNKWNLKLLKENEQLRDLNENSLPLSQKEYVGSLKGVPIFTHKDGLQAAIATLDGFKREQAERERAFQAALELGADLTLKVRDAEANLAQAVKDKDKAVKQAKEWKEKYQVRKSLDFGLLCGISPLQASACHVKATPAEAAGLLEKYRTLYPQITGLFDGGGVTTGRTQCKEPNQANPPKARTAMLQDGVATHDDGKNSRFRNSGSAYVITEDEDTKYYWQYEPLLGGVVKLTMHHTLPNNPRTFQDKKVDTGRMAANKPEVQHIPSQKGQFHHDMVDAVKWAIDYGQAEHRCLEYLRKPMTFTQPSTAELEATWRKRLSEFYFGSPIKHLLTLKVPTVNNGVWLWHDKQHPSRIFQIRYEAATGKIISARSAIGNTIFTWKVDKFADGYFLVLEEKCTRKS